MVIALRIILAATTFFTSSLVVYASDLTDQLTAAQAAKDPHSQIEILRRLIAEDPTNATLHERLTNLWLQIGDDQMALSTLDTWPGQPPASLDARTRASVAVRTEDPAAAITILTTYLADHPNDTTALRDLARLQFPAERLTTLDHLIELEPTAAHLTNRAEAHLETGAYTAAIADARAAAKLDPKAAQNLLPRYNRLEYALVNIEKLTAKIDSLNPNPKSRIENPKSLTPLLLRGYYYDYADLPAPALADAEAALTLAPASVSARILSADAQVRLGKIDSSTARDELSVITSIPTPSPEAAAALIDADVQALADPDDPQRITNLAVKLGGENAQHLLVLETADRALALDPANPDAALTGIEAALALGEIDEAAARFRNFEATNPATGPRSKATAALANAYFQRSEIPLALAFADLSLAAESTPQILQLKIGCLQRLGRADEANALLDQ